MLYIVTLRRSLTFDDLLKLALSLLDKLDKSPNTVEIPKNYEM